MCCETCDLPERTDFFFFSIRLNKTAAKLNSFGIKFNCLTKKFDTALALLFMYNIYWTCGPSLHPSLDPQTGGANDGNRSAVLVSENLPFDCFFLS